MMMHGLANFTSYIIIDT